jgi:hypothetical protein
MALASRHARRGVDEAVPPGFCPGMLSLGMEPGKSDASSRLAELVIGERTVVGTVAISMRSAHLMRKCISHLEPCRVAK